MDFEQIKDWILEKKVIVIGVILALVGVFIFFKAPDQSTSENNQALLTEAQSSKKDESNISSLQSSSDNNKSEVTVDISGAIKNQGVYTLKNGARIDNLIKVAGGLTGSADLKAINRATLLKDGDKIYIPSQGENAPAASISQTTTSSSSSTSGASTSGEKIHLNSATAADLQKLNGVGAKKAEQIIAYREQNGPFKSVEDLTKVSGIGEKTLAAFKDQLEL
ncbi:helix-hairpin-helix domain-containing protein [Lactobacillus psittaci]|uniref:Competence protein ComEA n=1 Tax=Lactobacillus psittaci DSM 15354 TaxID=1122152 RepID=A0A0R1SE84_9LACO|nr:helix-hairpin-helix domain-containing protein [Lactobacillus psittaci]KRL63499.1 competence protein ComEA [Lactobacillus psittaci DSM 15354]